MKNTDEEAAQADSKDSNETDPLVPKDVQSSMTGQSSAASAKSSVISSGRRFMYSDMAPREVRTSHTVASLFLGEKSKAEHFLFAIGASTKEMAGGTYMLWAMWYIGAIVGLLTVGGFAEPWLVWMSLLMLPLPAVTILLTSVDLFLEIVCTMDLYIIYILQIAFVLDGIIYCRLDQRRIFWYCYFPTMIASGLVDGYPARYRAVFAKIFFTNAIVVQALFNALLVFKWQAFGDHSKWTHVSFTLHHISDQLTLLCFYSRHLWCSVYYPDHFVMIKAEVKTGREKALGLLPPSARRVSFDAQGAEPEAPRRNSVV